MMSVYANLKRNEGEEEPQQSTGAHSRWLGESTTRVGQEKKEKHELERKRNP